MTGQQRLDDLPGIYAVEEAGLPGAWRYRSDRIWHNTDTGELVVIRPCTIAQTEEGDGYQVNIHRGDRHCVDTVLDNVSLDRAETAVARYIWRGRYPDDNWLADTGDTDR